jgi:hypothetical protein
MDCRHHALASYQDVKFDKRVKTVSIRTWLAFPSESQLASTNHAFSHHQHLHLIIMHPPRERSEKKKKLHQAFIEAASSFAPTPMFAKVSMCKTSWLSLGPAVGNDFCAWDLALRLLREAEL